MIEYHEKSALGQDQQPVQVDRANTTRHDCGYEPYLDVVAEYGLDDDMDIGNLGGDMQTIDQEYQAYVMGMPSSKAVDILKFWEVCLVMVFNFYTDRALQANCTTFPTIFAIAMDYLPVQASSVPCERVFSSSTETDTKRRNHISLLMMEALQMLKFHYKKECLNFMAGWATSDGQMEGDKGPEVDVLVKVLQLDQEGTVFQNQLDSIIEANEYKD